MAKDDAEKKDKPAEVVADPAAKKKKLILIGVGATLILGGGGGAAFFLMKKGSHHTEGATQSEAKSGSKEEGTSHGEGAAESEKKSAESAESKDKKEKKGEKEHGESGEKKGEKEHGESGENKEHKSESAAPVTPPEDAGSTIGDTFRFDTFHLNLGNPLYNHYIRMNLSVEFKNGELQHTELNKRKDQLRDIIISVTGKKTREFLLSPDGKDQLRLEITKSINRYLQQPIEAVYITDFLIE